MCTNLVIQYPNAGVSGVVDPLVLGARCLELTGQIPTSLFWIPRGQSYPPVAHPPTNPDGHQPLRWTSQYAFLGVAIPPTGEQQPTGEHCFMDGMNEEGLTVGALWLPGTTFPQTATAPYIWFTDLAAWLHYTTAFNGIMRSVDLTKLDPQGGIASISLLPDQYQSDWCVDVTTALAGSDTLGRG